MGAIAQLCPHTSPLIQQDGADIHSNFLAIKKQFSKFFRGLTSYPKWLLKVFCSRGLPEDKHVYVYVCVCVCICVCVYVYL